MKVPMNTLSVSFTVVPLYKRHYNSDLSIWLSVDPMSDKCPGVSPYAYCANNPVKLVDPDGREIDEWDFNIITGECQWVSNKGGKDVDYYNVHDGKGVLVGTATLSNHTGQRLTFWNPIKIGNTDNCELFLSDGVNSYTFNYLNDNKPTTLSSQPSFSSPSLFDGVALKLHQFELAVQGHADNSRWEGHGDYWERQFEERAKPYVTSSVLLFPPVSFLNSIETVTTGRDIYGNKADGLDYTLAAIGSIFGPFNFFRYIPKVIRQLDRINTVSSFMYYEHKKNKNEDQKQN